MSRYQSSKWMVAFVILVGTPSALAAPKVGDCTPLIGRSDLGVPLHPDAGNAAVSDRVETGALAKVVAIDPATQWLKVSAGNRTGWIIAKYTGEVVPCAPAPGPNPLVTPMFYQVGTWNLEHFHDGAERGFPENTSGGPTYPPRTQGDLEAIAAIIEGLDVKILVLEEIAGHETPTGPRSSELDDLLAVLGVENYGYEVASSGGTQRIALLYDRRAVRLNAVCETDFPSEKVEGKQTFARQPLVGHFSLLAGGTAFNDLLVVGVHLASGQQSAKNHDSAMGTLVSYLGDARQEDWCLPSDEQDILIAGDFNASRFDSAKEKFWDRMEAKGWDVLAEDGYPATRLAGVPLQPRSVIDYVIVSAGDQGLSGHEIATEPAIVHTELAVADPAGFRLHASDHLPVTVSVRVVPDTDLVP